MADINERKKTLEINEKAFEAKKKDAFETIKHNLDQMKTFIARMEKKPFDLNMKDPRNPFYENDITGELEHHLGRLTETFNKLADEESSLIKEKQDIEDEGSDTFSSDRRIKRRAQKIASDIMKEIGQVSSDSGLCWIGDPAYVVHKKELPENLGKNWDGFVDKLGPTISRFQFDNGNKGLGITVTTGGDGSFPVYAKTGDGKVKSIMIIFDNEIPAK